MLTKKNILLLLAFTFVSCTTEPKPEPYLLKKSRTSSCQDEIVKSISELIDARNLTISQDVFSKTSSLYLTNKKNNIFTKSPIINDLRGNRTLLLYKKNQDLYIGLLDKKKEVLKSKILKECP